MTQDPRTTESESRDNAAIRALMLGIKELTVPDRATLALGLIGHLATMMNRRQMEKLLAQLTEEAEKVQDVPPSRQGGGPTHPSHAHSDSATDPAPSVPAAGQAPVGQSGRGPVTETDSELL